MTASIEKDRRASRAPLHAEMQRMLQWAETHANSLAVMSTSFENQLDDLRRTFDALDDCGDELDESAKDATSTTCGPALTRQVSPPFSAGSRPSMDETDPSQIEVQVERFESHESATEVDTQTNAVGPRLSVISRHSEKDLRDLNTSLARTMNEEANQFLRHIDRGQWDFMVSVCESLRFQVLISIVILGSTILVSYEADTDIAVVQHNRQDDTASLREVLDTIVVLCFLLEVIVKLLAYRIRFFFGADRRWNLFDAFNAGVSSTEFVAKHSGAGESPAASMLRPIRAAKLLRLVRIFKFLHRFRELRLLAAHIMHCSSSLAWTVFLMFIVTYIYACIFLQAWVFEAKKENGLPGDVFEMWGSTRAVMFTLFCGPTGGEDWVRMIEPLWRIGAVYYYIYLAYIIFFNFVICNIVTSFIVEAVLTRTGKDDSDIAMEHMRRKHHYVEYVRKIFKDLQSDDSVDVSGVISMDVFTRHLYDTPLLAFAEQMGVEPSDLEHLFATLSCNGKHAVDFDTFVVSCIRMRGTAKSIDMMETLSVIARLETNSASFEQWAAQSLNAMKKETQVILGLLKETKRTNKGKIQFPHKL